MTSYIEWKRHVTDEHGGCKKYICPHRHCQNHFEHLDMLLDHVKKHKNIKKEPSTRNLRCTKCHKEFSRPGALKRHWLIHDKAKRILCPFSSTLNCKQIFYRMDALKKHLDTHHDGKVVIKGKKAGHACEKCSKVFSRVELLNKHQLTCPVTFSVHCDECGKGFRNQHAKRIHSCTKKTSKLKIKNKKTNTVTAVIAKQEKQKGTGDETADY
jgi:KRAB domain-containing zinc finger protein